MRSAADLTRSRREPTMRAMQKGMLPSKKIVHLLVNGTIVMKDQEPLKGLNPGQPIRFEPVESRFEPITIEGWTKTYYTSPIDFGGGVPGSQPRKMGASDAQPHTN